ncbi:MULTISPECIES: GNAT family N-acetyltransferase [Rhizobium]|uniref:GNAT family N-acetyltransferase n=1 Tax=Rhizobium TaxID=379 RepID=UPI001B325B37|nr:MULTISPECIES: GNAT family N-acetyltransferase [Rhizobium]MBX4909290.1 GNAT family N-acetyltransferase [Rhizobium bangladeshense]MBX5214931.1 GNAT family N-acetyltransferase [Rhizobium sp. NLR9a]MBX5225788.1 GNAT family N-acetyltransferase [Rhizobium sp. NLR9b]MBX5232096.1 GNAT family N-acetyltransferase [Rhizobium sp. NLR4a]MBX5244347.1 GNAT family N-acetyltransferase [Rhizobium sp. NLR3b]
MSDIRILSAEEARASIPALSEVLADCVTGGASVGFMQPYGPEDAERYWLDVADSVAGGGSLLVVAELDGRIVGTVQVGAALMPNQPHRGDLKKLLVHRSARGRGLARLLMEAAEREAAARGKTLLVLDTATGSDAEAIYPRLGWQRVGVIPDYALWPEGGFCDTTLFYKRLA